MTEPYPANGDSAGCAPISSELYRLLPLAMQKIDEALDGFWTRVESPQLPFRAFREFLERNFLAPNFDRISEVYKHGGSYRIKSAGAHYHVLSEEPCFSTELTTTFTVTPRSDLPDQQWAIAAFNVAGNTMQTIYPWRLGSGAESLSIDIRVNNNPVVIIAGLYLGYTYISKKLNSRTGLYDRSVNFD